MNLSIVDCLGPVVGKSTMNQVQLLTTQPTEIVNKSHFVVTYSLFPVKSFTLVGPLIPKSSQT